MFYFSDRPVSPSEIDPEQAHKVRAFKARFSPTGPHPGLYYAYVELQAFEEALHMHLFRVVFALTGGAARAEIEEDFVAIPPEEWQELFTSSAFAYLFIMYGRTWRRTYLQILRNFVRRGGDLRVVLPDPHGANSALTLMAQRIHEPPENLAASINEAAQEFFALKEGSGTVNVRYISSCYLNHSLHLFERGGVIGLYSYLPDRRATPAIRLKPGPLLHQAIAEFHSLYERATVL